MKYNYVITKQAAKDISKLSPFIKERIKSKLLYFIAQNDPVALAKPLADSSLGMYRWRVGDYRIVFDVDKNNIVLLRVRHRKDIYK
jgi:mRNA interferase RelE/StbE